MIVEGQRSDAIHDLVEEILWMDLLHYFSVDPIAHAEQSFAVDAVNRCRHHRSDARDQPSILSIEGAARSRERDCAPCPAASPNGSDQHVWLNRRMSVSDVSGQHAQVPVDFLG